MITLNKLKESITSYADQEFTSKMQGFSAIAFGMGVAGYLKLVDNWLIRNETMLVNMGVLSSDGLIDIDLAYELAKIEFTKKGEIIENLPIVGETKFTQKDLDIVYEFCKK